MVSKRGTRNAPPERPLGKCLMLVRRADWDQIEANVVESIRGLKAISVGMPRNLASAAIARDLILPIIDLLAHFCANVKIEDEPK